MRQVNAAALALLSRMAAGEPIPWVQLIEIRLAATQFLTTSGRKVDWNGNSWVPVPIVVSAVEDSASDLTQLTITLPAVDEAQLAIALVDDVEGRTLIVYDAILDPVSGQVVDAVRAWSGTMDVPSIEDGPEAILTISAEHRGTTALRPKVSRYTNDEQRALYAGDRMFDVDPATDGDGLVWPAASYFKS